MSDSDYHLGPFYTRIPAHPSPSLGPSSRHSDEIRSENGLPSTQPAGDDPSQELGDTVPHAPARLQEVPAEDPTHATNRRLGKSHRFLTRTAHTSARPVVERKVTARYK
jgi:hypothetical protein